MNTDLISYYRDRAREYENVYLKPERQPDIQEATILLQKMFCDKAVFEIACGTGFWTEKIAQAASSVYATDINTAVLEIARQKRYDKNNVTFAVEDCFELAKDYGYESIFGGFILSHIRIEKLRHFLEQINASAKPGSTIVFMDNNYVEGSNHPITETDTDKNTFQARKLSDGTTHLVLKNFLSESHLREELAEISTDFNFINLKYFWLLNYKTRT